MALTMRAFVDDLEGLSVTGVTRNYTSGPPAKAPDTADCPCLYVLPPNGEASAFYFNDSGGNVRRTADVVVLVEPIAQSTQGVNYDATIDAIDNLETALKADASLNVYNLSWTVSYQMRGHGDFDYHAVVCSVTAETWA